MYSGIPAGRRRRWGEIVVCHWEVPNCSNEAADNTDTGIVGSIVLGEIEAIEYRKPRHTDPDRDKLDRLHACSPTAALSA